MEHRIVTDHPENDEMLKMAKFASYMCIPVSEVRRLFPSWGQPRDGVDPCCSDKVLDNASPDQELSQEEVLKRGKACGAYLIGDMNERQMKKLRNAMTSTSLSRIREHTCGFEERTKDLSPFGQAAWGMRHCECRGSTPEEETVLALREYGIEMTFRSEREAKLFREGILSAVKGYVTRRIATMTQAEAYEYVMAFWGGGSYEGLLHHARTG